MIECKSCGAENPDDVNFCEECGNKLADSSGSTETKRICSQCGSEVPTSALFCIQCGSEVAPGRDRIRDDRPKAKAQRKKVNPPSAVRRRNGIIALLIASPLVLLFFWQSINRPGSTDTASPGAGGMSSRMTADDGEDQMAPVMQKINDLKVRIKNDSTDFHAYLELGNMYAMAGMFEDATGYYKHYVKLRPDDTMGRLTLAEAYGNAGKFDESIVQLNSALERDSTHIVALYNLGVVKAASGDNEGAKLAWEKIIEIDPESEVAQAARVNLSQL